MDERRRYLSPSQDHQHPIVRKSPPRSQNTLYSKKSRDFSISFSPREWLTKTLEQKDRVEPTKEEKSKAIRREAELGHGNIFQRSGVVNTEAKARRTSKASRAVAGTEEASSDPDGQYIEGAPEPPSVKLRFRRDKNYVSKPSARDRRPDFVRIPPHLTHTH